MSDHMPFKNGRKGGRRLTAHVSCHSVSRLPVITARFPQ